MKGLIYSWFVTRKTYFIVQAVLFVVSGVSMSIVLPLIDFSAEGDGLLTAIANFVAFVLGAATLMCGAESLDKDLESTLINRFTDYSLTAGISKKGYADVLLVRNLICLGECLAAGFVLMLIYLLSSGQQPTAELIMLVPCTAFVIHAIDYLVTPLVIKMKNAEKAGLVLGGVMGFIILICFMCRNAYGGLTEEGATMVAVSLDAAVEAVITAIAAASYIPVYFITLKLLKGGDVC